MSNDTGAPPTPPPTPVPTAWARALMPTAILACVENADLHGYAIAQRLGEMGLGTPKGGSLYPMLGRLEEAGHVTTRWVEGDSGPRKKEYRITDAGRDHLAHERSLLQALTTTLTARGSEDSPRTSPAAPTSPVRKDAS